MRKNLVILRCGADSLHRQWLRGGGDGRGFDLVLCPYEEIGRDAEADWQSEVLPGQKWLGVHRLLTEWADWRRYAYIWLPDDDLLTDVATVDALFALSARFEARISAPSLSEDSYFSHVQTMHHRGFFARATAFVEVMMPCFRRDALELVLPCLAESRTGFGWGMDYVWGRLIGYQDMVIFDCLQVRHTRPIGSVRDPVLGREIMDEMDRVMARHGAVAQIKMLGAYDGTGRLQPADAGVFLVDYLAGYRYLIARDEAVLAALLEAQRAVLPAGRPVEPGRRNLAAGRPAMVSSADGAAAGAGNDGSITGTGGFRTVFESEPWWQVDLGEMHEIDRVALHSRKDCAQHCTRISLSGSDDGQAWVMQAVKLDGAVFEGQPYVFETRFAARFVRVSLIGEGVLGLDEVEVFGS